MLRESVPEIFPIGKCPPKYVLGKHGMNSNRNWNVDLFISYLWQTCPRFAGE